MVSESIVAIPFLLAVYLYLIIKTNLHSPKTACRLFGLGLFTGVMALINASLLLMVFAFWIGILASRVGSKTVIKATLALGFGLIIAISPWLLRNYMVLGKPVFRTTMGYNLWRGNYPGASGTGRVDPENKDVIVLNKEYHDYLTDNQPAREIDLDSFYTAEACKFIKAEPWRFAKLTLLRAIYFVTIDPTHPLAKNMFYLGGYLFLLIFGVWGTIILWRRKIFDVALILMPLFQLFLYTPVMVLPRYRMVLVWILIVLASIPIANMRNPANNRMAEHKSPE